MSIPYCYGDVYVCVVVLVVMMVMGVGVTKILFIFKSFVVYFISSMSEARYLFTILVDPVFQYLLSVFKIQWVFGTFNFNFKAPLECLVLTRGLEENRYVV